MSTAVEAQSPNHWTCREFSTLANILIKTMVFINVDQLISFSYINQRHKGSSIVSGMFL